EPTIPLTVIDTNVLFRCGDAFVTPASQTSISPFINPSFTFRKALNVSVRGWLSRHAAEENAVDIDEHPTGLELHFLVHELSVLQRSSCLLNHAGPRAKGGQPKHGEHTFGALEHRRERMAEGAPRRRNFLLPQEGGLQGRAL